MTPERCSSLLVQAFVKKVLIRCFLPRERYAALFLGGHDETTAKISSTIHLQLITLSPVVVQSSILYALMRLLEKNSPTYDQHEVPTQEVNRAQ